MAKGTGRRMTAGTVFMLLLTVLVVIGCVLFFSMLIGDDLYARTGTFMRLLSEPEAAAQQDIVPADAPTAFPAYFWVEDTPVPTLQAATPTPVPAPATITIAAAGTVYAPKAVR